MKKLQILLVAVLLCGNVFAQETSVTIKLKCTLSNADGTISQDRTSNLTLVQAPGYHRDTTDTGEMPYNNNTYPNVGIYAKTSYVPKQYSTVKMDSLIGTPLCIATSRVEEYVLEFSNEQGDTLWLNDKDEKQTFPMVSGYKYHFTIDHSMVSAANNLKTIEGRFVIVEKPAVVEDYKICFVQDHLQISNYPVTENADSIFVKDRDGDIKVGTKPAFPYQDIDLSGLDAGQYIVIANQDTLTVSVKLPKTIK